MQSYKGAEITAKGCRVGKLDYYNGAEITAKGCRVKDEHDLPSMRNDGENVIESVFAKGCK